MRIQGEFNNKTPLSNFQGKIEEGMESLDQLSRYTGRGGYTSGMLRPHTR